MFKKFNTTTLIIILIVLGGIVAFNKLYLSKKSESTFSNEFVKIDTGMVTQILIYPKAEKGNEISLTRQANGWELRSGKIKAIADTAAVRNLLSQFVEIKSNALAGADKLSWAELQIDDTSGSRIKFVAGGQTFDLVIGKFGYNNATRSGISYVRHAGEEAVYAVDGFLTFAVNQPSSGWRNKTFISGNKDNWNSLTFTYPGDSSFVLARQGAMWTVNGVPADSAKTAQYLNGISAIQCSDFVEHYTPVSTPVYTLSIQGNNQPAPVSIVAYPADSVQKFILHSSLNPDAWFSEGQSHVAERVFVSPKNFSSAQ